MAPRRRPRAVVAEGLEAAKPFIAALCEAQKELADKAAKPIADYPVFPDYAATTSTPRSPGGRRRRCRRRSPSPARPSATTAPTRSRSRCSASSARPFAGREKEIGAAYRSLTKKLVRQRILTDHFRIDGRGITDIRALSAEVADHPAGARQRAVRARRDPDHGRHHPGHGQDGPADRLAGAGEVQALHAPLQLPAVLDR